MMKCVQKPKDAGVVSSAWENWEVSEEVTFDLNLK